MSEVSKKIRSSAWLWLSLVVIIIDQVSKWYALHQLTFHQAIPVTRFFNWFLDFNRGAAFNLLSQYTGWQQWLLSAIALMVAGIIFFIIKNQHKPPLQAMGLALILGGALGNMIDRFWHHSVIDFISWHIAQYYWPTFNVADSAVCLGVFLFLIGNWHDKKSQ